MATPAHKINLLADEIDDCPSFSFLVGEAVAKPHDIEGEERAQYWQAHISRMEQAVKDLDDTEAGRCLRLLIGSQLDYWRSLEDD